jgi:hypothetical protein
VIAYSDEATLLRLQDSTNGVFVPLNRQLQKVPVFLRKKAVLPASVLHDEILADIYGGAIAVSLDQDEANGRTVLRPHQSQFKMQLEVKGQFPQQFQDQLIPGVVRLKASPKSYAARIGQRIASVLIRELGL